MSHIVKLQLPKIIECPYCDQVGDVSIAVFHTVEHSEVFGGWLVEEDYYKCGNCRIEWQPTALSGHFKEAQLATA